MKNVVFKESQNMRRHWALYLTIVILIGISFLLFVYPLTRIIIPIIILASVVLFMFSIKMTTKISEEGIFIKFFPFHLKGLNWKWNEIDSFKTTYYEPLTEFGGWGIRRSIDGKKCYSTKGNFAFKIHVKNKKILIGTQKKNEANKFLKKFNKINLGN